MTERERNAERGVETSHSIPTCTEGSDCPFWGIMAVHHPSSVSREGQIGGTYMIMLFRDAGGFPVPGC